MRSTLVGLVVLMAVAPARATVLIGADLGELTRDARAIVRGRVVAVDAQWTADRRTIETLVTLEVERYLKGALGETVQFRVPGGVFGRFRSIVVGAPTFAVDDRVVVFLGAHGPSVPYVVGFSQGVFRIARSRDGSAWLVTPPALLPSTSGAVTVVRGDPARVPQPLNEFEEKVRGLVGGAR